jgi:hypothetical protein
LFHARRDELAEEEQVYAMRRDAPCAMRLMAADAAILIFAIISLLRHYYRHFAFIFEYFRLRRHAIDAIIT